jgi:diguanylate cyclase (GGDEF)-like protein
VDAFGAGVYLLFGLLHANLWLHRRDRPAHLWLAAASGGALLVDLTGMAGRVLGASAPAWMVALNLMGVALATVSLLQLVAALASRPVGGILQGLQAVFLLLAPLPGLLRLPWLERPLLLLSLLLLVVALLRAFNAGRGGDAESRTLARGLLALLVCLVLDVLAELKVLPLPGGLPVLGFTVLFLASGMALHARFEREHQELEALRQTLEERVAARTSDLEEAHRRLADASRTDPLTGLPNRRGFLEAAGRELARIQRAWRPCTILLVDVDHFRRINEAFGHATGDAVLQGVAALLRATLRGEDLVAHWSAEEFIVLLPETAAAEAQRLAESIRRAALAADLGREGEQLPITFSFGVMEHRQGFTLEGTIAEAERALLRAHALGPNHLVAGGSRPSELDQEEIPEG